MGGISQGAVNGIDRKESWVASGFSIDGCEVNAFVAFWLASLIEFVVLVKVLVLKGKFETS